MIYPSSFPLYIGVVLRNLHESEGTGTQYRNPNVCFSLADDSILLTDGTLWDLRTPSIVHRFDKLSNGGYGVFHPNGNEVIIDSTVWDLRTHNLLRTNQVVDQCVLKFSAAGDIIYAYRPAIGDDLDLAAGR